MDHETGREVTTIGSNSLAVVAEERLRQALGEVMAPAERRWRVDPSGGGDARTVDGLLATQPVKAGSRVLLAPGEHASVHAGDGPKVPALSIEGSGLSGPLVTIVRGATIGGGSRLSRVRLAGALELGNGALATDIEDDPVLSPDGGVLVGGRAWIADSSIRLRGFTGGRLAITGSRVEIRLSGSWGTLELWDCEVAVLAVSLEGEGDGASWPPFVAALDYYSDGPDDDLSIWVRRSRTPLVGEVHGDPEWQLPRPNLRLVEIEVASLRLVGARASLMG